MTGSLAGLADDLEARLHDVVRGAAAVAALQPWARALPRSLRLELFGVREPDLRTLVTGMAIGVLLEAGDDAPVELVDVATWLKYLGCTDMPGQVDARSLAAFAEPPDRFAQRFGLDVLRYVQPGLGICRTLLFPSDPPGRWFTDWWPEGDPSRTATSVAAWPFAGPAHDATAALRALFATLPIDEHDACWLCPEVDLAAIPEWTLRRIDDNANCVAIATSRSPRKLALQQAAMERTGHRQLYEIVAGHR